jgi:hypothetical protein
VSPAKNFRARYTDALWAENALRPNELLVALAYVKYAGAYDPKTKDRAPDDLAWVAWVELSERTKIRSKDALNRAVKGLVDAGWMRQVEARKQHRAPRYQLTIPTNPEVRHTVICEDDTA